MPSDTFAASLADLLSEPDERPDWKTAGDLAAELDPGNVQTPALDLIDAALLDVSEGRCNKLIVSMPPQEGKSSRITRFWVLQMLMRNPNLRVAIVSYADDIAQQFSYALRHDISTFDGTDENVDLGLRLRRDSKAASRWFLQHPHKGGVYAIGIGSALTGRAVDLMVIDDPVKDPRAADSELLSEMSWQWWMSVGRTRLAPGAPVVLVLTRWHENDLAGRLLKKQAEDEAAGAEHYDKWRVVNIPAQADHDPAKGQTDPLGREPGEFMVSARGRSREQWETTKTVTSARLWSAMYQGRPSPETGNVWQRTWWRRYEQPLWTMADDGSWRVDCDEMVLSWDMAFKDTRGSDYVVGQVWARRGAEVYLLDQVHKRLSFTDTMTAFTAQCKLWPQAVAKLVEDKANGTAVIDSLKRTIPGIVPISPHESKYARANAVAPFVEAGNVLLPTPAIQLFDVEAFIDEAAGFPNAAHDDQVDAASQALGRLLLKPNSGAVFLEYMKRKAARAAEERSADPVAS